MRPERWQRVKELMLSAAELDSGEQAAFLDRACGEDRPLRELVEALLLADASAASFLEIPAFRVESAESDTPAAEPCQVGPYEILGTIGRGGMGSVYLAVRSDDEYENQLAVKVLKPGPATEEVVRRFRTEGRILAGLEHPNIARLLDGGTTDNGLPYLAIEYVQGEPIDHYCHQRGLSVEERLRLFRRVCSSVQFAHRNLVVHRDIKPSNILVTSDGEPKLLDFGIAKLLDPELSGGTLAATATVLRLMTPEYASPEQVRGEAITTATDVYSLGLVLFVLLTGSHPYRLKSRRFTELLRWICDGEPPPPSVVAGAQNGHGSGGSAGSIGELEPRKLSRRLKGDLDHIVLRALRKDPECRYPSVEQFSEDVQRHLSGRPVVARKGTLAYRMGKLVRRHAAAVAACVMSVGLVLAVAVTMALQRQHTVRERDRAEQVSNFLVDLFEATDPYTARGKTVTARELLGRGAERIRKDLQGQDELRAALMDTMGRAYMSLGAFEDAEGLFENALELRREVLGERHPDVGASLDHLGQVLYAQGDYRRAEPFLRRALEVRQGRLGSEHPEVSDSLNHLAAVVLAVGDHDEAEYLLRQAIAIQVETYGPQAPAVATMLRNLAVLLRKRGEPDAAAAAARESLEMAKKIYGSRAPEVASALHELSAAVMESGGYEEAEALCREALGLRRQLFDPGHYEIVASLHHLARLLVRKGSYADAEGLFREVLTINRRLLGEEHANVATPLNNLAKVLYLKGDYAAAEKLYREALALFRRVYGDEHLAVATAMDNLASVLREGSDLAAAERLAREALTLRQKLFGDEHLYVAASLRNLARLEESKGDREAAEPLYREALTMTRRLVGPQHPRVSGLLDDLARLLSNGRQESPEAEVLAREALAMRRRLLGEDHMDVSGSLSRLASVLVKRGDFATAEPLAREAVERLRRAPSVNPRRLAEGLGVFGACLAGLGRYAEAEPLLLDSHNLVGQARAPATRASRRLADLYEAWGRPEDAESYRAKLSD